MAETILKALNSKGGPQLDEQQVKDVVSRRLYKAKNSVGAVPLQLGLTIGEASG
jgi:hypothetical protein